jgi:hypothetical protein
MGFQDGWIVNPALSVAADSPVPGYHKSPDGGLGGKITTLEVRQVPEYVQVDPDVWAQGPAPARAPLVLAADVTFGDQLWIERAFLADPAYQLTVRECQDRATELDKAALAGFWQRKRAEYDALTGQEIQLTKAVSARPGQGPGSRQLPPGPYPVLGTADWTFKGQQAPFTVVLGPQDDPSLVNPARLDQADESGASQARAAGAARKLSAAEITAPFASLAVIGGYVPGRPWLTDDHVHYLTPDEMGAVFVLRRPPGQGDVESARKTDPGLFAAGAGTPGVRYGDDIFIQLSHLGIGAEYHEAIHLLSQPAVRAVLGFDFNEGVTEYFTRQLLAPATRNGTVFRDEAQYQAQLGGVSELVSQNVVTEQELAAAYFAGSLQPLFTNAAARLGAGFSLQGYAMSLTSRYHHGAEQLLAQLAGKPQ